MISNCHKRTSGKDDDLFLVGAVARHSFCFRAVRMTNASLSLVLQPGEQQQLCMGSFSYTPYLPELPPDLPQGNIFQHYHYDTKHIAVCTVVI